MHGLAALHRRANAEGIDGEGAGAGSCGGISGGDWPQFLVDLQPLALAAMRADAPGTYVPAPGLKLVAARWLRCRLDKTLQCSDWDQRPLTAAQLRYAATDAAVLIDLAEAMKLTDSA